MINKAAASVKAVSCKVSFSTVILSPAQSFPGFKPATVQRQCLSPIWTKSFLANASTNLSTLSLSRILIQAMSSLSLSLSISHAPSFHRCLFISKIYIRYINEIYKIYSLQCCLKVLLRLVNLPIQLQQKVSHVSNYMQH